MARKKKVEPIDFKDLITQPRQLARLPMMNKMAGYRILIAVLQRLQGLWKIAKMPQEDKKGQLYLNYITDEFEVKRKNSSGYNEGDVVFRLRLSDIALDSHYAEARQALVSLTHIKCFIPDKDNPGYYRTGDLMEVRGKRVNGQFVGTDFEVIVPRLTAENILDINLFSNYTRFVAYTAGRLRSSFSYPLYIYLSEEWRHHGEQFIIPIRDLRFRLGFVKDSGDPERETRYSTWSTFCQKVLDQAKRELDDLARVGGADFTFTYQGMLYGQPLPPYKRPDAVAFTILPTKVGEELQQANEYTPNREAAKKLMTDFYKLTAGQTYNLLRRVTPDFMQAFLSQLIKWQQEIESGSRNSINNRPGWAYKSIDELIRAEEKRRMQTLVAEDDAFSATAQSQDVQEAVQPDLSALDALREELRAVRTGHMEEAAGPFEDTLAGLVVDHDQRYIRLKGSGALPAAVEWYWDAVTFDAAVKRHFEGYEWGS